MASIEQQVVKRMREERLRERRKRQTHEAIADAARRLFRERGFDAVTVAEVARLADVSEQTVFNHFRSKEDLFFSGMEAYERELVEAVRRRPAGESALTAFRRTVVDRLAALADPRAAAAIASAARVIAASRVLENRERAVLAEHTRALAEVLTAGAEREGQLEALVVAHALMGIHAALLQHVRALALRGLRGDDLVQATEAEVARAFDRLERGLRDYAVNPGAGRH